MIFHLNSVTNPSNIVIRTLDDVLNFALGCMSSMSSDIKVDLSGTIFANCSKCKSLLC